MPKRSMPRRTSSCGNRSAPAFRFSKAVSATCVSPLARRADGLFAIRCQRVVIKYLISTRWQRMANRPSALLASGDTQVAETAFENLKAGADRFPQDDVRRGMLLFGMGAYVYNRGRAR